MGHLFLEMQLVVFGVVDVVAVDAIIALGCLTVFVFIFQSGHFDGGAVGLGHAAFGGEGGFIFRIFGVQSEHAEHGFLEAGGGVEGVGALGTLGAVAAIHRAISIDEHRRPAQVVVKLELTQIHAFHFHLAE